MNTPQIQIPPADPEIEKFCKTLSDAVTYYQKEGYDLSICAVMNKKGLHRPVAGVFYKASDDIPPDHPDLMYHAITINNNPF